MFQWYCGEFTDLCVSFFVLVPHQQLSNGGVREREEGERVNFLIPYFTLYKPPWGFTYSFHLGEEQRGSRVRGP